MKTIADILEIINEIDSFNEKFRRGLDMNENDLTLANKLLNEYRESLLSKKVEY